MTQNLHPAVEYTTLAQKVDLLLRLVRQPDGRRYTYEDLERKSGIKSSTLSRIRSGENTDPYFMTILALSEAFMIDLEFFSTEMTPTQVEEYLTSSNKQQVLQELRLQQFYEANEERNQKLQHIALRAAQLDDEGINAIADILDYVLKQKGIRTNSSSELA